MIENQVKEELIDMKDGLRLVNILKQSEHKEGQKDEFMGFTMTSHDFKHDMDRFYISQAFQRVQDHPIRSSNEKDTAS